MTENHENTEPDQPTSVPAPAVSVTPVAPVTPVAAAAPARRRRAVHALVAALVVLALAGIGVGGWLAIGGTGKHQRAATAPAAHSAPGTGGSASPATPVTPYGARADGTHYGPLTKFLIATPSDFTSGPDVGPAGAFGPVPVAEANVVADVVISDDAPNDTGDIDLYRDTFLGNGPTTQFAVESLAPDDPSGDTQPVVTIALDQRPTPSGGTDITMLRNVLNLMEQQKNSNNLSIQPSIPGHPNAVCWTANPTPASPGAWVPLNSGMCVGVVGDVTVVVAETQTTPVDGGQLSKLFQQQLAKLDPETSA
jgi:hypothetical protein